MSSWGGSRDNAGRKPFVEPRVPVSARLDESLVQALDAIAQKREQSRAQLIEEAVKSWIVGRG